jgi:hypothetical protein
MRMLPLAFVALFGWSATRARPVDTHAAPARAAASLRVQRLGAMTTERAAHQATLLADDRVIITGGCARRGCSPFLASVELFDPLSRRFVPAPAMSRPRASHTATLLRDGRVLVAGGCTNGGATASAELYEPIIGRWRRVGDMTAARCSHIAVPLDDGRVFVMGGGAGRLGDLATAEVFDPRTLTFTAVGPMHENHYLATRLASGLLLLTGGQGRPGEILRSAEIVDPSSGTFRRTGDMGVPRVKHAAALLPDGRVLIIGGSVAGYEARFNSTEVYDPKTGRFAPGPSMREGRYKIRDAVVTLASGGVLVAGGAVTPELYDVADRTFVPLRGELDGPEMFATATRLRTGEVLLLGGYDPHVQSSASAWIVSSRQ